MSKETNKLIPEIRFPEFVNEGEWEMKSFEELFEIGNGRDYKHLEKGEIPVYGSGGYMLSVNDYLYNGESVCIGRKGTIDKPMFLKGKFWTVDTLFYTHSFKKCLPKYIYYIFQNINWIKHNESGGVPSLTKISIYKIKTLVPKPNEQQKIALCLSSLDEVIAAHSLKLEALKAHKKGLMQNLFPQEGETVPNYRFREFAGDGKWMEKKLDEVCEINPKAPQLPEQFIYIDLESVENGVLLKKKIINSKGAPRRAQRLLNGNDVIFQTVRPYQMNNYYFENDEDFDYVASSGYAQLRSFESSMYLYQLIHTDRFVSNVLEKCTGSNYPAINSSDLSQISVQIPNPKEQNKIASCLSSLDALITGQAEKIEQLKLHKKGLMQDLFPKISD